MTAKKPTAAQTAKANTKAKSDQVTPDFLEVKTVKGVPSFRRAGLAFTQQPTRIPLADLSEEKIAALMNEDRLTVTPVVDQEGAE
jgi:hypothetical protein